MCMWDAGPSWCRNEASIEVRRSRCSWGIGSLAGPGAGAAGAAEDRRVRFRAVAWELDDWCHRLSPGLIPAKAKEEAS